MRWKQIVVFVVILAAVAGIWGWRRSVRERTKKPALVTAPVERGPLTVSVSATGVLQPLTTVDVKSRSGGEITHLYVEPGDRVVAGQMIAQLDPTPLRRQVEQSRAGVRSSEARVAQARLNAQLQVTQSATTLEQGQAGLETAHARVKQAETQLAQAGQTADADIMQAQASVSAAEARLKQAEAQYQAQPQLVAASIAQSEAALTQAQAQYQAQPQLTGASIAQSEASLKATQEDLAQLLAGSRPQEIAQAEASVRQAQATTDNALKALQRQQALLEKGFISQQSVDDAERAYETARAQLDTALSNLDLVKAGPRTEQIEAARARVAQAEAALKTARIQEVEIAVAGTRTAQAEAALETARAQQVQIELNAQDVEAAKASLEQARAGLATATANRQQVDVRAQDLQTAKFAVRQAEATLAQARTGPLQEDVRRRDVEASAAQLAQAQSQLEDIEYSFRYTTIPAPRDGIVLQKHVEEGTVIPAGTSPLAQGTAIVTLADITKMYVMTDVDETDIGGVRIGQPATIHVDVLSGRELPGRVEKIYPEGVTEQEVVRYQVRVELLDLPPELRPGMTADVTITLARLADVVHIPDSAIERAGGKTSVQVLENGKPARREIQVGLTNWTDTQVVGGLQEGEEVVMPAAPGPPGASSGRPPMGPMMPGFGRPRR